MAIAWTKSQQRAIDERNTNSGVLVSAAAGSGKTAVLVERIIRTVLDDKKSIDRMLVVTFTEAAASQMRDKIIREMYKKLKDSKDADEKEKIKEQIRLAGSADIMTIDSFCLRVLRNNFYALGIDPNFRISDAAEGELMAEEAMDSLFDRLYCADIKSDEAKIFNHLLNVYATNSNDKGLKGLVMYIHRFIQSFAKPIEWLLEKSEMYSETMEDSIWVNEHLIKLSINKKANDYYFLFKKLLFDMAGEVLPAYDGGVLNEEEKSVLKEYYGAMVMPVISLVDSIKKLTRVKSWKSANKLYESIKPYGTDEYTARNNPKDKTCDAEIWKAYCKRRNDLRKKFFEDFSVLGYDTKSLGELFHGKELKRTVDEIVWLVKEFDKEFTYKKDIRNVKEFSDIEHQVYKLFEENDDIREFYKEKYEEILIDEYQDTNGLQNSIFESISRDKKNIFMVGDLKQSIYRFRGGDPTIFKGKSKLFGRRDNDDVRIKLSENFRSRQEILYGVNEVFERIMSDALGDVDYDDTEKIVRKSDKDVWESEYICEGHFIAFEGAEEDDGMGDKLAFMSEARFVAKKIKELVSNGFLVKDGDKKRPVTYGDVTILSRSVKGEVGDSLMAALGTEGINSYVEIEDFFSKREIRLMLSLLAVIDNNLQDIPLSAVMRSPIGGFSDNDLARIRIYSPNAQLINAVKNYRLDEEGITNEEIALKIKCRNFVKNLSGWRNSVKRKSVANLIWTIYEETGFYDFMGAMDGGEESQANLRLLYERAKKYEQSGSKGLFNFIKYIEKIRSRRTDLSSANLTGENNLVRIMTIHKSKGLEFPVVFLIGTKKKFNRKNDYPNVLLHNNLGFGIKYADEEKGYFKETLFSQMIKEQNIREDMSEDMRLLYVALTRAKDKLFVVASEKLSDNVSKSKDEKLKERIEKWQSGIDAENALCYADWVFSVAAGISKGWNFYVHEFETVQTEEKEEVKEICEISEVSRELYEAVKRNFEYEYAYPLSGTIPAKTSVTALKQRNNEIDAENADRKYEYDPIYMVEMPDFMRDKKLGTEIGTAHHQVMAYIHIEEIKAISESRYEDFIKEEILRISKIGQVDSYYAENEKMCGMIAKHLSGFFKSRIGREILNSDNVYREQPFQVEIGADEYDEMLDKSYADEKVILQGVIDCFYETDRGLVLVDYKTDYCKSERDVCEIVSKYSVQLNLYANAIERITGKKVAEKYLYLFAVDEEREIK